jgi:hypothetical protein
LPNQKRNHELNALLSIAALAVALMMSCSNGGGGEWPQAEQDAFIENCVPGAQENTEIDAEAYCACMLEKMMKEYPEPEDVEDMDMGQMMDMAKDCL